MIVKVHRTPDGRRLIAVCDNNLLGKKFEENDLQLDLSSNFYKGEELGEDQLLTLIKSSYLINSVGEDSVKFGLKIGAVNQKDIIKIKNIPHVQSLIGNF